MPLLHPMTTLCPKCHHVRQATETSPAWQCPACGVAYAKAADAARAPSLPMTAQPAISVRAHAGLPWGKLLMVAVLVWAAWAGQRAYKNREPGGAVSSLVSTLGAAPSVEQLAGLGASAQAGDVLFYGAPWCPYCTSAKGWMGQYRFKYEECDIQTRTECADQLTALGSDGVPYLIVKGHHMKRGFDSHESIVACRHASRIEAWNGACGS